MDIQEFDTIMDLLIAMECELKREKLSLALCDAWLDVEHLLTEMDFKND